MPETSARLTLSDRMIRRESDGMALYAIPSPMKDVISFGGSIRTWPDQSAGAGIVQDLAVALLDKGTRRRDRFAIADLIDNRGARLSFQSNATRISFFGRALKEDFDLVIELLADQLRDPLFDPAEFEKARARFIGDIRRSMENPSALAHGALMRQMFQPSQPNYAFTPEARLEAVERLTVDDVTQFYAAHAGRREFTMAVAGDVGDGALLGTVVDRFRDWCVPTAAFDVETSGMDRPAERVEVYVPDKQNVDVRLGHWLPLRRGHQDYLPLSLGTFILGGNFSSRLMTYVRDRRGLTYGIQSALSGMTTEYDGYWRISVTLSPDKLEEGIEATLGETGRFVEDGPTEEEVEDAKTTIIGAYEVDLASTDGLVGSLLTNIWRGLGPDYVDQFPLDVAQVDADSINEAIRSYLRPQMLHAVVAGSV